MLHDLLTPDFAFVFFYLGLIFLVVEIIHPGISVPAVLGVVFLATALAAFGRLPVEPVGVLLLAASVGFFLLELKLPGLGVHSVAGTAALVLGGLFLFNRSVPGAEVSPWVIAPVAVVAAAFFVFVVGAATKARRMPHVSRADRLTGAEGIAKTQLDPGGVVLVASESWTAVSSRPAPAGALVRVTGLDGLRLRVEPVESETEGRKQSAEAAAETKEG